MGSTNSKVDAFLERQARWRDAMVRMRRIALSRGLTEEVKWGQPCYTDQGRNIVLIHGFKDYCALLFFKGALVADPEGLMTAATGNVQAARQIRFRDEAEVQACERAIAACVDAAIAVERSGAKVAFKTAEEFAVPQEFQEALERDPGLAEAFHALTPGRRKAYLLHFAGAKQSKTRQARIEKHAPRILEGKGLED